MRKMETVTLEREVLFPKDLTPAPVCPLPEEGDACIEHLRAQVRIIRPGIIVCLGRISAQRLIKPDFRITREHGVWFSRGAFEMCAVYHPSALLHDPSKREDMLEDMRSVAEKYRAIKEKSLSL